MTTTEKRWTRYDVTVVTPVGALATRTVEASEYATYGADRVVTFRRDGEPVATFFNVHSVIKSEGVEVPPPGPTHPAKS